MKAITVRQPYATLLCMGLKTIETRTSTTNYRGPLLIHASKSCPEIIPDFPPLNAWHERTGHKPVFPTHLER
jgi:hypothetical protein